jgi:hypothetical protein
MAPQSQRPRQILGLIGLLIDPVYTLSLFKYLFFRFGTLIRSNNLPKMQCLSGYRNDRFASGHAISADMIVSLDARNAVQTERQLDDRCRLQPK